MFTKLATLYKLNAIFSEWHFISIYACIDVAVLDVITNKNSETLWFHEYLSENLTFFNHMYI